MGKDSLLEQHSDHVVSNARINDQMDNEVKNVQDGMNHFASSGVVDEANDSISCKSVPVVGFPKTNYDLSAVIHLTHSKTKSIVERGYKITGFVLTDDAGRKCISDMSAVRWFDDRVNFFRMMPPDNNPPPASEQKPKPVARDWPEDFKHENGNYFNSCVVCGNQFQGHKRRAVCKACSAQPSQPDAVSLLDIYDQLCGKKPQPDDVRDAERYRWLRKEHDRIDPLGRVVWKRHDNRNGSEWCDVVFIDAAIDAAIAAAKGEV